MHPHTIIFIGPQGSGKGTQVELLKEHLSASKPGQQLVEVQTGAGFRALAEGGSYTSLRVKNILEHGSLVPDFLTESIVVNQLARDLTSDAHIIMDGFPRNLTQAQFIDEVFTFYLRSDVDVVYLDTPEDVVRKRLIARGRSDDTDASITERLRIYREMTEPLVAYYKERDNTNFVSVNGAETVETVHAAIKEGLGV